MHWIDALTWIVVAVVAAIIVIIGWHYVVYMAQVTFGLFVLWLLWKMVSGLG